MEFLLIVIVAAIILYFIFKNNSSPENNPKAPTTFSLKDAGYNFYETYEVTGVHLPENKFFIINYVSVKDPLTLKSEPTNIYDPRAIAIYHKNSKIGYIADHDLEEVHEIMKQKHVAGVESKTLHGDWLDLYINIYFEEEI